MQNQSLFQRSTTVQNILKELRRDIMQHKFRNQTQVTELQLAGAYGCSRAAVRNALFVLEKEGLVVTRENGTRSISCFERGDIDNLYELRSYLELTAIKHIASHKENDFTAVLQVVNRFGGTDTLDVEEILELDMQFHTAIIKTSRNKAVLQAWLNISDVVRELFSLNMTESAEYKSRFRQTFRERHLELTAALLGDPEKLLVLMESHIQHAHEVSHKTMPYQRQV